MKSAGLAAGAISSFVEPLTGLEPDSRKADDHR